MSLKRVGTLGNNGKNQSWCSERPGAWHKPNKNHGLEVETVAYRMEAARLPERGRLKSPGSTEIIGVPPCSSIQVRRCNEFVVLAPLRSHDQRLYSTICALSGKRRNATFMKDVDSGITHFQGLKSDCSRSADGRYASSLWRR